MVSRRYGRRKETGYRTEFIVALNNQPQGDILTRAATRSPDVRVGLFSGWGFNAQRARGARSYNQRPQGWFLVKARRAASGPHDTQGIRRSRSV